MAIVFRLLKNAVTSMQFLNIPLALAFVASYLFGSKIGLMVGFFGYVFSDLLIYPGLWTIVNSLVAGLVSYIFGLSSQRVIQDDLVLFMEAFLLCFFFDLSTSTLLYILFGLEISKALVFAFIGLFLPVMGGYLIGVGPLTEFSTSILTVLLIRGLEKRNLKKDINIG
jgi:energy-coupling factor transport system substrate-specific component